MKKISIVIAAAILFVVVVNFISCHYDKYEMPESVPETNYTANIANIVIN